MRIMIAAAFGAALLAGGAAQAADAVWHHAIIVAKSDSGELYMVGKGFAEKQGLNARADPGRQRRDRPQSPDRRPG